MAIARLLDGGSIEVRDVDISEVPPHKAEALGWKSLVYEGSGPNEQVIVEANQIRVVRTPPTKTQLKAHAQACRRAKEIGGVTITGIPVYTDPESQAKLHAARTAAKEDANYTVKWKGAGGAFFALNATQIVAIADAVRAHVQVCFDAEEAVAMKIDADVYTTYEHIDGASEWPTV